MSIKPARFGNFHTECCYKIKKPTSKFNRKRKPVIQSSYIRIKYYNLLYKSISHPLTKKTKQKTYMNITIPSVKNRKIRERKQKQKKLTIYKLEKSKAIVHEPEAKKTTLIIPNVLTDMKNVKSIRRCLEK